MVKKRFLWGNSVSSMQTEGAQNIAGKGPSVYDIKQASQEQSDFKIAIDSYHKYKEDFVLMKHAGMNAYRFQISWSRVMLMSQYLTRKLLERTDMMIVGQSYPFKFRLASFILADTYRGEYSEPHAVVMAYLGISYRHLLNTYQQFETAQLLIKVGRNRYQVNTAKLKQLAGKAISR